MIFFLHPAGFCFPSAGYHTDIQTRDWEDQITTWRVRPKTGKEILTQLFLIQFCLNKTVSLYQVWSWFEYLILALQNLINPNCFSLIQFEFSIQKQLELIFSASVCKLNIDPAQNTFYHSSAFSPGGVCHTVKPFTWWKLGNNVLQIIISRHIVSCQFN